MDIETDTPADDYDSPWKEAVERYFPEFMEFYFAAAHAQIDWSKEYVFLDQELRTVIQEAEHGKRILDKLVRVTLLDGGESWIYIHIEIQGQHEKEFPQRMYVYNYRIFDRYRTPVASMAVLVDDAPHWKPDVYAFELLGCELSLKFPIAKLTDYLGQEEALHDDTNPFALVTLASLLTRATRKDMQSRYAEKWKLVQLLYRRGWDKQRIIDLFLVLDWMMQLPPHLKHALHRNIEQIERIGKMRYISSVEQIGIEKGLQQGLLQGLQQGVQQGVQQGLQQGEALALRRLLAKRFGALPDELAARIAAASLDQVETWFDRAIEAPSLHAVFENPQH
ncbi:MAG TPA: DUF4351 domain-containing protein [Rhodocyclaceae bacterium]|nr:DUF4351 domain-containing protein [Rhodocyclaceae bacterium]